MDKTKSKNKQKECQHKELDDMTTLEFQCDKLDSNKKKDSKKLMNNLSDPTFLLFCMAILAFAFISLDSETQNLIVYIAAGIILFCIGYKVFVYIYEEDLFAMIGLYCGYLATFFCLFGFIYFVLISSPTF